MFELDQAGLIRVDWDGEMDSPTHDPHSRKYQLIPSFQLRDLQRRFCWESPGLRFQFWDASNEIRKDSTSGDYSPQLEVHLTEITSKMDGGNTGKEDSDEVAGAPMTFNTQHLHKKEQQLDSVSSPTTQETNEQIQIDVNVTIEA